MERDGHSSVDGQVPRARIRKICGIRRSTCLLASTTVLYVIYLVFGSFVFNILETDTEMELRLRLRGAREMFLRRYRCIKDEDLEKFIELIVDANNRGVSAVKNVTMEPNWSFGQSLFFSGTVVTTIGYGHVTPLSEGGKLFCIVYALIGIPLTLILVTAYVERLMIPSIMLLQYLNLKLGHYHQAFNIRILHLVIVIIILMVFFFLIPAALFNLIEPTWNYLDSLYYCFISLTTIGLGDYIPGDSPNQKYRALYKVCATGYLLIGLTFMMSMLSVLYDIPQLNFGLFFLLKSDESTNDPEKARLHSSGGIKYTQHIDEPRDQQSNITTIRHIKAVPDPPSSSPDEISDAHH